MLALIQSQNALGDTNIHRWLPGCTSSHWTGSLLRTEARRQQVAHKLRRGAQVAALLFVMIQNTSVVRRSKSEHWSPFDNDTKEKWTFPLLSIVANTARIQFGDLGIYLWVRPPVWLRYLDMAYDFDRCICVRMLKQPCQTEITQ